MADNLACPAGKTIDLEKQLASAGSFANLRKSAGSLNYETGRMLDAAVERLKNQTIDCKGGCGQADNKIVLKSIPNKFITDSSDSAKCQQYFEQTSKVPLKYKKTFPGGIAELQVWISQFSQGSGAEGKDLYVKCDGACSPQYTYYISFAENQKSAQVQADVICGPARDKSDNQYQVSTALKLSCKP